MWPPREQLPKIGRVGKGCVNSASTNGPFVPLDQRNDWRSTPQPFESLALLSTTLPSGALSFFRSLPPRDITPKRGRLTRLIAGFRHFLIPPSERSLAILTRFMRYG
jgi:hypothetical protein